MKKLQKISLSGAMVYPLIEGGKGINGTDGKSSGAWAKEGGVGTISMVSPTEISLKGTIIPEIFHEKIREYRHREMVEYAIKGGISQAKIAHEIAGGNGRIHINMLWEMADSQEVITRVLDGAKGLIHGVTCGAGLPYNLGAIASEHQVYYYPIISSARAMAILWKRSFRNYAEYLGGVVYEDPWLAGGHNGLSNAENPLQPERPYERLIALRHESDLVVHGTFRLLLPDSEELFVYERELGDQRMLVACNFCDHEVAFDVPEGYEGARRVAENYAELGPAGTLRPYECYALLAG